MKQQYRSVCFRGTELIGKNKKQSVIKSNTAALSTTVTKPAQSPVPVINKRQPQDSNRQLTPRRPTPSVLPVTRPVAQSTVPVINKRKPQHYNRQLTHRPPSPSALPVTWPVPRCID